MTSNKFPEILFISHDAFRGGATLFLLNVQRWLREHTDIRFSTIVVVRESDEMLPEFRKLGPVICISSYPQGYKEKLKQLVDRWNPFNRDTQVQIHELKSHVLANYQPGLIYSNTIVNGDILEALKDLDIPVLTYVHEMDYTIRRWGGDSNFAKVSLYTDHYIGVSKAVCDNLIETRNVPAEKMDLIYGFVPTTRLPSLGPAELKKKLANELDIAESAYIIGCCGVATWRKGCDLLVHVSKAMPSHYNDRPIHFVWLGMLPSEVMRDSLYHDIKYSGISDRVHFIGARSNPLDYIATFDVLALLSREDPFPLVVMEAAALNVPTVCFEKAGGSVEFVKDDAGISVPYLDCKAFANACLELLSNPDKRTAMAAKAMERVQQKHDINVIVPQILQCISKMTDSIH